MKFCGHERYSCKAQKKVISAFAHASKTRTITIGRPYDFFSISFCLSKEIQMKRMSKVETDFELQLIKDLEELFPGCYTWKLDPDQQQGIPDLLILFKDKWAILECKRSMYAKHQPNQDYYVELFNRMSFSAFIYPENREETLDELQRAFRDRG